MSNFVRFCAVLLVFVAVLASSADAIERVGRKLNFVEISGSYLTPTGEVESFTGVPDELFPAEIRPLELDANEAYDGTFALGIAIGQVNAGSLGWSLGFRYTKHDLKDSIDLPADYIWIPDPDFSLNQYDLELNVNYYLTDITQSVIAPYVGVGVVAGILSGSYDDEDYSESELKALGALNFGFDLRLWEGSNGRDMVSLVSQNRYDLVSTEERPRYWNFGAALRFYIRP